MEEFLLWIKDILNRYIVVEDSFINNMSEKDKKFIKLIPKLYEFFSLNNIPANKTETGEYISLKRGNLAYRIGKYNINGETRYFICHDVPKEEKEKVKVLRK